jgi:uncharacterized protein with PQ loop repeat
MNPRWRAVLQILFLIVVLVLLFAFFPRASQFVEMAARELRYFWWILLLIALAVWLIWGVGRKRK